MSTLLASHRWNGPSPVESREKAVQQPESSRSGDVVEPTATRLTVLPAGAAPGLVSFLRGAGCDVRETPEGHCDAVLVVDARDAVRQVVELRSAGFRGPIVCALTELSPMQMDLLRTAGANAVGNFTDREHLLSVMVARMRSPTEAPPAGLDLRLDENARRVRLGAVETPLSGAQYRLFTLLAREPGRWWTARELVTTGFETHHADDSSIVRVHMNGIRKQLGIARWCLQSERTFGYQLLTNVDALSGIGSRRTWSHGSPGRRATPASRATPDSRATPAGTAMRDRRSGVYRVP